MYLHIYSPVPNKREVGIVGGGGGGGGEKGLLTLCVKVIKRGGRILRIRGVRQKCFINKFFIQNSYFYFRLKVAKKWLTKFKVNLEQENTALVHGNGCAWKLA